MTEEVRAAPGRGFVRIRRKGHGNKPTPPPVTPEDFREVLLEVSMAIVSVATNPACSTEKVMKAVEASFGTASKGYGALVALRNSLQSANKA